MEGIIYKYTSPSGKVYIGQTKNEEVRRKSFYDVNHHYAGAKMKQERLLYPNFDDWKYEVIDKGSNRYELDKKEIDYIIQYTNIGLNTVLGEWQNNPYLDNYVEKITTDFIRKNINYELSLLENLKLLSDKFDKCAIEYFLQDIYIKHIINSLTTYSKFHLNCGYKRKLNNLIKSLPKSYYNIDINALSIIKDYKDSFVKK